MEEVRDAIGIDKVDMSGNLVFVEENHNADANFILHAIISHCVEKHNVVCLALFHNTFGHFHNVGMKLGYNLKRLCDESRLKVIEPLKLVAKNVHKRDSLEFDMKSENSDLIRQLVQVVEKEFGMLEREAASQKVYFIVDDLSHLIDIGLNVSEVWLFIRYMRSLLNEEPLLTLCVASHVYKTCSQCETNLAALSLKYFADLVVSVQPLETGYSRNVSGKVSVRWKSQYERLKFKWPEEMIYLFKLHDRQVRLFAPGSSHIM